MATDTTTVQAISDNQNDVATDLASLLSDNSINDANISNISIVPYGLNQFLIVVTYA